MNHFFASLFLLSVLCFNAHSILSANEDDKLQVIRAHDGKIAWTATRLAGASDMVKEALPPDAADALLADASVIPRLIKLWREGAKVEMLESTTIAGENAFTLKTRAKTGQQEIFYLSSLNYQLLQYERQVRSKFFGARFGLAH